MKLSSITTAANAAVVGLSGLTSASPPSLDKTAGGKVILFDLDMPEHNTSDLSTLSGPVHAKLYPCGNNNINNNKVKIQDLVFDPYPPFLGQEIVIQYDFILTKKMFASAATQVRVLANGNMLRYDYDNFCASLLNPNQTLPCPCHPGNYTIKHQYTLPDSGYNFDYTMQFVTWQAVSEYGWGQDVAACTEIRGRLAQ